MGRPNSKEARKFLAEIDAVTRQLDDMQLSGRDAYNAMRSFLSRYPLSAEVAQVLSETAVPDWKTGSVDPQCLFIWEESVRAAAAGEQV